MLKKVLSVSLALILMFGLTACSEDNSKTGTDDNQINTTDNNGTQEERPFTESNGLIKYFTIEDENVCLPETVGEYVRYLEKIGTKVELGDTGKTVDEAPDLNAGGVSSMVAFLKVYLDDSENDWQWFGIRYKNDTDDDLPVADCKVTQITLDYDIITEEENHHGIDSIVFITNEDEELAMNGKTTSHKNIFKMLGDPAQNTDGHLHYSDDQGYKYEMVTENQKGVLTRVVITYPED